MTIPQWMRLHNVNGGKTMLMIVRCDKKKRFCLLWDSGGCIFVMFYLQHGKTASISTAQLFYIHVHCVCKQPAHQSITMPTVSRKSIKHSGIDYQSVRELRSVVCFVCKWHSKLDQFKPTFGRWIPFGSRFQVEIRNVLEDWKLVRISSK